MRCPHCGGLSPDGARYCTLCGQDVTSRPIPAQQPPDTFHTSAYPGTSRPQAPFTQRPGMPQQQPVQRQGRPYQPNPQQPQRLPASMTSATAATPMKTTVPARQSTNIATAPKAPSPIAEPSGPEPPAPFPPRSIPELKTLEQGALSYTGVDEEVKHGRRKVVRITFQRCVSWQQVATLFKALKDYDTPACDTIIIQGVQTNSTDIYNFTNGQLIFDRNVRLGSLTQNRYQIETGNGFSGDSVRIVLSESS